jgi:hypothetical protein
MSDFADVSCGCGGQDPSKRVRYTRGMVLGEDDLHQEQLHLRARDDAGVRALHGYGTVSGLDVRWDLDTGRLDVAPGLAVDPVGRLVCVPAEQCADLLRWLDAHREDLVPSVPAGSLPAATSLYVVLCHRECETDTVPLPSETCRTAEESMAPSRVQESFELRILLTPPVEAGEVAGGRLSEVVDGLLDALGSVPAESLADVDRVRQQLVAWVTRDRPELATAPCLEGPAENCGRLPEAPSTGVLLARVDLDLDEDADGGLVLSAPPLVVQEDRPVLLSTRFLQEWMSGLARWRQEPIDERPAEDHNLLDNLDVGDVHSQYLPVDGSRPLQGDLDAGGNALTRLAPSTQPHHALRADEVFGGDLARGPGGARLDRLQGVPVAASGAGAPGAGDVLRFDGAAWVPGPPGTAQLGPVLPLATVQLMGRIEPPELLTAVFLVWVHLDVPSNGVLLVPDPGAGGEPIEYGRQLIIQVERCQNDVPSLRRVDANLVAVRRLQCNTFRVEVRRATATMLRFVFDLRTMFVDTGQSLSDYTLGRNITWLGQDGENTVTTFVLNPAAGEVVTGFEDVSALPVPWGGSTFVTG